MRHVCLVAALLAFCASTGARDSAQAPMAQQAADPANGQRILESRCLACHGLEHNRVGPALGTVCGREAGTAPGFAYSPALRSVGQVWSYERLMTWLADPQAMVPGQAMGYRVDKLSDRQDVVAYLATLALAPCTP